MKGVMKKTVILLAAALICFLAYGGNTYALPGDTGTTDDGIQYKVNDDGETVTLTGYEKKASFRQGRVLVLPDTIEGLAVTDIGDNAFSDEDEDKYYSWTGVVLPSQLKTIGAHAFDNNSDMTGELVLPDTLTTIGEYAFYYCSFTGELKLPESLTSIGDRSFMNCSFFSGDLKIPFSVTNIGKYAFKNMYLDGTLELPNPVTTVGSFAFEGDYFTKIYSYTVNLTNFKIYNASGIFYNYSGPGGALSVEDDVSMNEGLYTRIPHNTGWFRRKDGFIYGKVSSDKMKIYGYEGKGSGDLIIPDTVDYYGTDFPVEAIADGAFAKCTGFTGTLSIPDTVTELGKDAFLGCSGLSGELDLNNVNCLGVRCFNGCSRLSGDVRLSAANMEIDGPVFKSCDGLTGTLYLGSDIKIKAGKIAVKAFLGTKFRHIINENDKVIEVYKILSNNDLYGYYMDGGSNEKVDNIEKGEYSLYRSIEDAEIIFTRGDTYVYAGAAIKPQFEVRVEGKPLTKDVDYTLEYKKFDKPGDASLEISGKGFFLGKAIAAYKIVESAEIAPIDAIPDQIYSGKVIRPAITFGGVALEEGSDYTAVYSNNTNAGIASVVAIGRNSYSFVLEAEFKILPASISEAVVADIAPQTYTGEEIKPDIEITVSGNKLVADRDYTLTYKDNIDKETATVTATGKGNYTGSVSKEFKISGIPDKTDTDENDDKKENNEEKAPETPHSTMTPLVVVPEITDKTDAIYMVKGQKFTLPDGNWEIKDNINKTVNIKKDVLTAKKVGTAKIARGTQNITVKVIQPKFAEKSWTEEAGKEITLVLDGFDKEHYGILWSSSNVDVASVSGNGIVKTLSKGTATITAYVNGKTYSCRLKVTESTIAAERTLHINTGTPKPLKIAGIKNPTWEVVSGNAVIQGKNKVSAKTAGTSKLLAKTSDGKSYVVYVIAEDIGISAAGLEDKGKNKYNLQLAPKGTTQISFKGVERQIIWKSSSPEKAYVDENGVVHALKEGKCKFTTKVNGKNITINVVVK